MALCGNLDTYFLFLAIMMVITGSINTLSTKVADITKSAGSNGEETEFNHPFFQAAGMFLGEFLCILAFKVSIWRANCSGTPVKRAQFNPMIFILPACCDMAATSLMYIGLNWTYASVFQMLRGSVVIFTGIMSVIFLKKKLYLYHWTGMFFVLIGLGLVGVSSVLLGSGNSNAPHPIPGDIIIICAQVIVSVQMVIEEKFISKYEVPALQVVGWEGIWGFLILSTLLIPFYFIPGPAVGNRLENVPDAFYQIYNSWIIMIALIGNILSIAFFNFFGISITKYSSATTRMVLDSIRTLIIWGFSLIFKWQEFQYLQVIGFVLLLLGTIIYNEILVIPFLGRPPQQNKDKDLQPLLNEEGQN